MTIAPGTTSQSITIQIVNDSGLAVTGLVAATFPTAYYKIAGNTAAVAITLSDLALITTAYASGGVKEISGGYYRLDLPNAALASAGRVTVIGDASGKHLIAAPIDVQYVPANMLQISDDTTAADNAELFFDGSGYNGANNLIGTVTNVNNVNAVSGAVIDQFWGATWLDMVALGAGGAAAFIDGQIGSISGLPGAVWDELTADHTVSDSFGNYLNAGLTARLDEIETSIGFDIATANGHLTDIKGSGWVTGDNMHALLAKFAGITVLAQWLGLIAGKQVGNTTARTELRATGAGGGTYDETTDALQAIRDSGSGGGGGGTPRTVMVTQRNVSVRD